MTDSNPTLSLGWVIAYVDDPAAASAFYAETFGLTVELVVPDGSYAQMDTGGTRLAFASYALGDSNFPGITLVTTGVDAAYARAVDAGCEPLAAPEDKPQGQRVSYVRDPFGTLVEIASPL